MSGPFVSLETASPQDWRRIIAEEQAIPYGRCAASLMLMREQQGDPDFGLPIYTYRHGLQTEEPLGRFEPIVEAYFDRSIH